MKEKESAERFMLYKCMKSIKRDENGGKTGMASEKERLQGEGGARVFSAGGGDIEECDGGKRRQKKNDIEPFGIKIKVDTLQDCGDNLTVGRR
jgi:hypothetical protein